MYYSKKAVRYCWTGAICWFHLHHTHIWNVIRLPFSVLCCVTEAKCPCRMQLFTVSNQFRGWKKWHLPIYKSVECAEYLESLPSDVRAQCAQKSSTPPGHVAICWKSRVPDQNGVSLLYIIFEIHQSGQNPRNMLSFKQQIWMLFLGCLMSQQHASVSQGRICSDNFTCCHTEIEVADQTYHFTQSWDTDTGPTSHSTDPIAPGAWQGSHWNTHYYVTGLTRPRKNPGASGNQTRDLPLSKVTVWSKVTVC